MTNRWRRAGDRGHMGFTEQVLDVAGLNRELPGRVQQLLELKGDKLRK